MKQRYEQFFPITSGNTKNTHIQAEVYYSLGGYNVFTGKTEPRGYYLSVSPVEKAGGLISYMAYSGAKKCIMECARQSQKRFEEAKEIYKRRIKDMALYVCPEYSVNFAGIGEGM